MRKRASGPHPSHKSSAPTDPSQKLEHVGHELFAERLAAGDTAVAAAKRAGFSGGSGGHLVKRKDIQARRIYLAAMRSRELDEALWTKAQRKKVLSDIGLHSESGRERILAVRTYEVLYGIEDGDMSIEQLTLAEAIARRMQHTTSYETEG